MSMNMNMAAALADISSAAASSSNNYFYSSSAFSNQRNLCWKVSNPLHINYCLLHLSHHRRRRARSPGVLCSVAPPNQVQSPVSAPSDATKRDCFGVFCTTYDLKADEETKSWKKLINISVSGAAGMISNHLLFKLASGEVFGQDQPIALKLLGSERSFQALEGVAMELEDSLYPLLREVRIGIDPYEVFQDAEWALLIGAKPRGPGMERAALLDINGQIYAEQGKALNAVASRNVKVMVVGNPCNTNALICLKNAPNIPAKNFHALTRLDENRAKCQLALKAGVFYDKVSNMTIWGNHSTTQVPDFLNAKIDGKPVKEVITDIKWLEEEFTERVQKRGGVLIQKWGRSSAASTAVSIVDAIRSLITPTPEGDWFSSGRTRVIDTIDHFFKVNLISVDDARIQDLLRRAGFLHYSRLSYVRLDRALITALIERWRSETYTFHLPVGEMTITLQDVAVLLGLRIDGPPVVGSTGRDWEDLALRLLGRLPPASDKKKGQVRLVWLREQFSVLPPADATQAELEQYARGYILHQIGCSLFPDTSRNVVHLRWLTLLDDLDHCGQMSWGSAVLAFLYSELTEAALGRDKIGGCLTLLLAWSWTRVAVGMPTLGPREYDPLAPYGHRYNVAKKWDKSPAHALTFYRGQLDRLSPEAVMWEPYSDEILADLPVICRDGHAMWRARVPMLCWHAVQLHLPDRVLRQFGLTQHIPDTIERLQRFSSQGRHAVDWGQVHATHIQRWEHRLDFVVQERLPLTDRHDYMSWYSGITRRYILRAYAPSFAYTPDAPFVRDMRVALFQIEDATIQARYSGDYESSIGSIEGIIQRFWELYPPAGPPGRPPAGPPEPMDVAEEPGVEALGTYDVGLSQWASFDYVPSQQATDTDAGPSQIVDDPGYTQQASCDPGVVTHHTPDDPGLVTSIDPGDVAQEPSVDIGFAQTPTADLGGSSQLTSETVRAKIKSVLRLPVKKVFERGSWKKRLRPRP